MFKLKNNMCSREGNRSFIYGRVLINPLCKSISALSQKATVVALLNQQVRQVRR
jgi:hypothetical protein